MGHSELDCNIVYANPDKVVERAYGPWPHAPAKNAGMNDGSRWLYISNDEAKVSTNMSS